MSRNLQFVPMVLATRQAHDVREMSFQTVVDKILQPAGLKMGGFPEDMFLDLTEEEQQEFMCNICYLIANDSRQCDNKHVFCRSCILAWSMTYGENSNKCPMCRCVQREYVSDKEFENRLTDKRVRCLSEGCSFKAPLRIYLMHNHGKMAHSNAHVDFEKLHREHQAQMSVPRLLQLSDEDDVSSRAVSIREQLLQGRMMIHQMMLLMHLEMQLRQQALTSYHEAQDPTQRLQRLDDVMALNEQLNEVGSILSTLLSVPLSHGVPGQRSGPTRSSGGIGGSGRSTDRFARGASHHTTQRDSDVDDDDDIENVLIDDASDDGDSTDDNSDTLQDADDDILQVSVLDRDDQLATLPHRNILVGRRRLAPAANAESLPQPRGVAEAAVVEAEARQHVRPLPPSPPAVRRMSNDQPHHILNRRQETQLTMSLNQTSSGVDVEVNETRGGHHPLTTLPRLARQADVAVTPVRDQSQTAVAAAAGRSVGTVEQSATDQTTSAARAAAAGESAARSVLASGGGVPRSSVSTRLSRNSVSNERRDGPVAEPWPSTSSSSADVDLSSSLNGHTRASSRSRSRNNLIDATMRTRYAVTAQTNNSEITYRTRLGPANGAEPGSRALPQPPATRRPQPDYAQADHNSSGAARRSSHWPTLRSLSRDSPGSNNRPAAAGALSVRPPAAARTQMVSLPSPARTRPLGQNGTPSNPRPNDTLRPRRRSEIAHDLMFPPSTRRGN